MKRIILLLCLMSACFTGFAQHDHDHEGHGGHDHEGETHDHADAPPGVLFEELAAAIAGQDGERVLHRFTGVTPRFGLAMQKGLFAEAGLGLDFYKIGYTVASEFVSFGYDNLRPYIAGEIMINSKLLGGGKAGIEYIRSTPILGMAFGGEVGWYTDGAAEALLVTPRLMLSFVKVEVYYGYSFFVRNELRRWLGHHRFGVSMTLNPRFWRRKNRIYEDYYNTYLGE